MKNLLIALCFLLISSCFQIRPEPQIDYDHMLNSTAALVAYDMRDQSYHVQCAGVFISETEVLTAAHCVALIPVISPMVTPGMQASLAAIDFVEVGTYADFNLNHDFMSTHIFAVSSVDFELDLALLSAVGEFDSNEIEIAAVSDVNYPRIGSDVFSIGHPMEIAWNLSSGLISRRQSMFGREQIVHASTNSFFGSSGGPLFSENGDVLGIAHAITARQSWLSQFTGPRSIREFLDARFQEN